MLRVSTVCGLPIAFLIVSCVYVNDAAEVKIPENKTILRFLSRKSLQVTDLAYTILPARILISQYSLAALCSNPMAQIRWLLVLVNASDMTTGSPTAKQGVSASVCFCGSSWSLFFIRVLQSTIDVPSSRLFQGLYVTDASTGLRIPPTRL
jgi:hypothetical protein